MILIDAVELKRQKTVFNNDFDKRMTDLLLILSRFLELLDCRNLGPGDRDP